MFYKKASVLVEEKISFGVWTKYYISLGKEAIETHLNCK